MATVVVWDREDKAHVCGSAFLIYADREISLFFTAWHVVIWALKLVAPARYENVDPEDWPEDVRQSAISKIGLVGEDFKDRRACPTLTIGGNIPGDVAILVIPSTWVTFSDPSPKIGFDSAVYPVGTEVFVPVTRLQAPIASPTDADSFLIPKYVEFRRGRISKVAQRGMNINAPVYATTVPIEGGVSGSPVFAWIPGKGFQPNAIGIVSSDFSEPEAFNDPKVAGCSFVVLAHVAQAVNILMRKKGTGGGPTSMMELIERKMVRAVGPSSVLLTDIATGSGLTMKDIKVHTHNLDGVRFTDWE